MNGDLGAWMHSRVDKWWMSKKVNDSGREGWGVPVHVGTITAAMGVEVMWGYWQSQQSLWHKNSYLPGRCPCLPVKAHSSAGTKESRPLTGVAAACGFVNNQLIDQ